MVTLYLHSPICLEGLVDKDNFFYLNNTYKLSFYSIENTLRLHYEYNNQPVKFVNGEKIDRLERILTMVYVVQNSQNFSGPFPSSCIPKNTTFRKLDLFPSSG
jgi:hypothetical protein